MKVFGEERLNTYFSNNQSAPAVGSLSGGGYVVAWVSDGQDGSVDGIYAQRLDANGVGIGAEFRVNSTTGNYQNDPAVVGLSNGGFLIVWADNVADGSSWGVFGQRYDAEGVAQGMEFRINTYSADPQAQPGIAAYDGGFVVTWYSHGEDGSGGGVYSQRYDNTGAPVGTEALVNTMTTNHQYEPDVAAYADGSFVVAWRSENQESDGASGVYAQRYDSSGAKAGGEMHVNSYTANYQFSPRVDTLSDGGFVVVWTSRGEDGSGDGVYGQRYDASGNLAGGEFLVNVQTDYDQGQADVAGLSTGGFVVTWYNYYVPAEGRYHEIYAREYDAAGNPVGGEEKVNSFNGSSQTQLQPVVTDLGQGNYAVVWSSYEQDGSQYGIYQQIFGNPAEFTRQANPELADFGGAVSFGENAVNAGLQVLDAAVSLSDLDSANFDGGRVVDGGRVELFLVQGGGAEDRFGVRNEGNAPGKIGVAGAHVSYGGVDIGTVSGGSNGVNLVINLNANATVDAVEALLQNLGYANTSSAPTASRQVSVRVSDGDGGSTVGGVVTLNVTPETDGAVPLLGDDQQVNTYTASTQELPIIAALQGGNHGQYVIVWQSAGQDGDSWGVFGQRYDVNGSAIGAEFRVNTTTAGAQYGQFMVGIGSLSTGGFVVVWESADGSGNGIYAQRYDVDGQPLGSEFQVNQPAQNYSEQIQPRVLGLDGGAFVVAYTDYFYADSSIWGVRAQHYDANGVAQGAPVTVNTYVADNQSFPQLARLNDGGYVVAWHSLGQDGSEWGVYARLMNADGTPRTDEIPVNTYTDNTQRNEDVATLANGDFVVSWRSNNPGLGGWSIMAQRFTAAGVKVGGEVLVSDGNTAITNGNSYTQIAALESGGYVITWSAYPAVDNHDVYAQQFDAAGNKIDAPLLLNHYTSSTQYRPDIAALTGDRFVAAWQSYGQDGDQYGIYQQVFGNTAELPHQAKPELTDFVGMATFAENSVNAGLQVIDSAVSLTDSDSANFSGGRLDLYYLSGAGAEDQLGVVHQGNDPGQIGVAGHTVSYGGVTIGTLSGGADGANLRIDFSSDAATPEVVKRLIERLGYSNTDSSPNASRSLGLRVSDGDGGSSTANVLTISVTQEVDDGTPKAYGQEQLNTFTPDHQDWPAAATLSDGSYVVTWDSSTQDGAGYGIHAQRFSHNGEALGAEFRVNTLTGGNQTWVQIAALSNGGFVITWQDDAGHDGSGWGVYGQRYDATGAAQGGQFLLNTATSGNQVHDN